MITLPDILWLITLASGVGVFLVYRKEYKRMKKQRMEHEKSQ